ncbi:MAG: hypothetical protein JWM93_4005 [Frankiales bacterium]|nr:hypothetical protein [Frankiales bacterium]
MSRPERVARALLVLGAALTAAALLVGRPRVEPLALGLLTIAISIAYLAESVRAAARRRSLISRRLQEIALYGHAAADDRRRRNGEVIALAPARRAKGWHL